MRESVCGWVRVREREKKKKSKRMKMLVDVLHDANRSGAFLLTDRLCSRDRELERRGRKKRIIFLTIVFSSKQQL